MHDVVIIGAGPAGLSAALWCDELGLKTLVLEERAEIGGQLLWIYNSIENHLGGSVQSGHAMRDIFAKQIAERRFSLRTNAKVETADLHLKQIRLHSGERVQARCSIIIATGLRRRRLGIPGETELLGRGVIESARRDRNNLAGRDACVIGGGDAAAENALLLADVCPRVTLVHRGVHLRARPEFIQRLAANRRINVVAETVAQRIIGEAEVEAVEVTRRSGSSGDQSGSSGDQSGSSGGANGNTPEAIRLPVQGVVVRIGYQPNTEMWRDQAQVDRQGYLLVTSQWETTVKDAFAVGDVANPVAPTISGATGAGATAAKVIAKRSNSLL